MPRNTSKKIGRREVRGRHSQSLGKKRKKGGGENGKIFIQERLILKKKRG